MLALTAEWKEVTEASRGWRAASHKYLSRKDVSSLTIKHSARQPEQLVFADRFNALQSSLSTNRGRASRMETVLLA